MKTKKQSITGGKSHNVLIKITNKQQKKKKLKKKQTIKQTDRANLQQQ